MFLERMRQFIKESSNIPAINCPLSVVAVVVIGVVVAVIVVVIVVVFIDQNVIFYNELINITSFFVLYDAYCSVCVCVCIYIYIYIYI